MKLNRVKLFLFFVLLAHQIQANPVIIQDQRVSNRGATPIIGRGYAISTNTYQSICFSTIKQSEPSYDFVYQFIKKDDFLAESSGNDDLYGVLNRVADRSLRNKVFSQPISEQSQTQSVQIIASLHLKSYYASLDESKVNMSDSATKLIQMNDLLGFFSSCGSYYIKSMIRDAVFLAEFQFKAVDSKSDSMFIRVLENQIKRFKPAYNGPASQLKSSEVVTTVDQMKFREAARERNLTIKAAGFGIGKNEDAQLISFDMDSFKIAIKSAFISMQIPNTGKVTAVELIPWIENTQFQRLLFEDEPKSSALYEKKYNISLNAELLAEIERVDRHMIDSYYKAKMCRKFIDENWKNMRGNRLVLKPVYINRYVMNNYSSRIGVSLSELDKNLTDKSIENLFQKHQIFMYGNREKRSGAQLCLSKLHSLGLSEASYRNIPECKELEGKLANFNNPLIDNYCMPALFDKKLVPHEIVNLDTF